MLTVLLLSAGTNACFHVANVLHSKFPGKFRLVGADINKEYLIATSKYLDKFYQVPYTSDPSYYAFILDICRKENIDIILPSFDADQLYFYPENKDLLDLGIKSLGTSQKSLTYYSDKSKMFNFLESQNLPVPQRYSLTDIQDEKYYFIKPINGAGSIGARKILGKELLKIDNPDQIEIQEVCSEPEFTLECFHYNEKLYSVARERLATKAGVCVKTRIFQDSQLHDIARKFISCLDLPMYFNLQFMKNTKGEFVITDVNLRLAGGMSLSAAAGWDEISALAYILLGDNTDSIDKYFDNNYQEKYIVRAYQDIVTKVIL